MAITVTAAPPTLGPTPVATPMALQTSTSPATTTPTTHTILITQPTTLANTTTNITRNIIRASTKTSTKTTTRPDLVETKSMSDKPANDHQFNRNESHSSMFHSAREMAPPHAFPHPTQAREAASKTPPTATPGPPLRCSDRPQPQKANQRAKPADQPPAPLLASHPPGRPPGRPPSAQAPNRVPAGASAAKSNKK